MAIRVDRIEERLKAVGLKAQRASLDAGLSKDGIRNLLRGASVNGRSDTLTRVARVLDCSVAYLIDEAEEPGEAPGPPLEERLEPTFLPIRYEVGAGYWVEEEDTQVFKGAHPVGPQPKYSGFPQWLERVIGDSMDKEFLPGTLVHVVDAIELGYTPKDGDFVVVVSRERGGHKVERSVKQVRTPRRGQVELWPCSRNPRWNQPLDVSKGDQSPDHLEVEIVAKVIGAYRDLT